VYTPSYNFREGVEPTAYQVWPSEQSELIHEACAATPQDREFPLYADDVEMARCLEPIICDRCETQIAEALEQCPRCQGRGQVEGYGGNMVPCGLCAETGFKHDLEALK
jgi:hypothetical protein